MSASAFTANTSCAKCGHPFSLHFARPALGKRVCDAVIHGVVHSDGDGGCSSETRCRACNCEDYTPMEGRSMDEEQQCIHTAQRKAYGEAGPCPVCHDKYKSFDQCKPGCLPCKLWQQARQTRGK